MKPLYKPLLALFLALLAAGHAKAQSKVLLRDVTIVNVATGTLASEQSVLIRDGTIAGIASGIGHQTATRVDGAGGFLIPGLWDSHVHISSTPTEPDTALPVCLINGITGIRGMGALRPIAKQQALQQQIETSEVREACGLPGFRLQAMTDAVRALTEDSIIASGRHADLMLRDANPLESLAKPRRPQAVVVGGRVLDRALLDRFESTRLERGE